MTETEGRGGEIVGHWRVNFGVVAVEVTLQEEEEEDKEEDKEEEKEEEEENVVRLKLK